MTRHALLFGIAVGFLGAAAALQHFPREVAEVPLATPLAGVPIVLEGWAGSDQVPSDLLVDPGAPSRLFQTYRNGTQTVWISVDYYPRQAEGQRPPAQALLYPGRGWSDLTARPVQIPLDGAQGGAIPANLVLMRVGGREVAIVYWYQIQQRSVASDHWYRALLFYNRLVRGRADGALVRVASPVPEGTDPAAVVATLTRLIQALYPELLRRLPR